MLFFCFSTGHVFGEYFSEDWVNDPYTSGWIGDLGGTYHTCFEWDSGSYVYEAEPWPAHGSGYFYGMYFNDAEVTAELQLGTDSYDLTGIVLWENSENFYNITYDRYREDFRFGKIQEGIPLCDWSSGQTIIIPSSGTFTLSANRSGNQFDLMIDYQSTQYTWIVNDSLGTPINNLKLGLILRYQGAKCFSLSVNGDCTSPEIAVDNIYISTWPSGDYQGSQWFPTDSISVGTLIANSSPVSIDSIRLAFEYNGSSSLIPDAVGGPIEPGDSAWVYSYIEIPENSTTNNTFEIDADPYNVFSYENETNNHFEKDYSIYYAEVADSVFSEYPYTYGQFTNSGLQWSMLDVYIAVNRAYQHPYSWDENYLADLIIAKGMYQQSFQSNFKGLCYGMSSASGAYYTGALDKPYPKQVFDYTYEEAKPDLIYCHILQGCELDSLNSCAQSGVEASEAIRNIVGVSSTPAIFDFQSTYKHAVLAYRVIETSEHMYVYCYNPNESVPEEYGLSVICYQKSNNSWYIIEKLQLYQDYPDAPHYSDIFGFPYGTTTENCIDTVYVSDHFASKSIPTLEELGTSYLNILMAEYLQDDYHAIITDTTAVTGMIDNYGRRSGFVSGVFYDEIPDLQYFSSDSMELVIIPDTLDYEVELTSIVNDSLNFDIIYNLDTSTVSCANWHKVPTMEISMSYIDISEGSTEFILGVDYDGDETIDEYLSPDYQGEYTTGIEGTESGEPATLELITFPNPVSESLSITYGVPESGPVEVSLYDLAGRVVISVENTHRAAGSYSTTADCSELPTGMYICTIKQGIHLTRRNLVVLH